MSKSSSLLRRPDRARRSGGGGADSRPDRPVAVRALRIGLAEWTTV